VKWTSPVVAGFAKNAGWTDKDLVFAVAVALAASEGEDALENVVDFQPIAKLVGLWQVPDWMLEEPTKSRLTNPVTNAKAAYALWLEHEQTWNWLPTFRTGGWRFRLVEAALACKTPQMGEEQANPIVLVDIVPTRRSAIGAIGNLLHQISGFGRSIGN
jgi:hypothetical protein